MNCHRYEITEMSRQEPIKYILLFWFCSFEYVFNIKYMLICIWCDHSDAFSRCGVVFLLIIIRMIRRS